ncbi:hypothetical protein TNCV_3537451 [Trichonephila clavipes]|nr:hypothetical protein TNCV_3537451 [Trichonephila clavipes]
MIVSVGNFECSAYCTVFDSNACLGHFLQVPLCKLSLTFCVLPETHSKEEFYSRTAMAGSDVVQSGRPIFDDFFQHLWSYIGNNTANVVFQMVKRLWLIRIDQ